MHQHFLKSGIAINLFKWNYRKQWWILGEASEAVGLGPPFLGLPLFLGAPF